MELPEEIRDWLNASGGLEQVMKNMPSDEEISEEANIHQALSDPLRLKILHLLSMHCLCVCVIKEAVGIADSKLSYHLSVLKSAGLINGNRRRNWIIYEISARGMECLKLR
jgi:ArsR family transcriptional regulator